MSEQEIANMNKETIRKFHNRIMKVVLKDEREFVGRFVCVDNKMNTILKETTEYRKKPTTTSSEQPSPPTEESHSFDERRAFSKSFCISNRSSESIETTQQQLILTQSGLAWDSLASSISIMMIDRLRACLSSFGENFFASSNCCRPKNTTTSQSGLQSEKFLQTPPKRFDLWFKEK